MVTPMPLKGTFCGLSPAICRTADLRAGRARSKGRVDGACRSRRQRIAAVVGLGIVAAGRDGGNGQRTGAVILVGDAPSRSSRFDQRVAEGDGSGRDAGRCSRRRRIGRRDRAANSSAAAYQQENHKGRDTSGCKSVAWREPTEAEPAAFAACPARHLPQRWLACGRYRRMLPHC